FFFFFFFVFFFFFFFFFYYVIFFFFFFFFQAEDGIRDRDVTGVQTCALPISMPNRKKAEENAPSRKYFMAASCESSRRRRASPHSRYSGSDSTSSATNMVSRSFEAGKSIIPPTANIVSGKISVCMIPPARASRSSGLPGVAAAC